MKKELLRFSYSKFSTYERCPRSYKFKYIDKVPQKPKSFFALGSSVHKALELFHSTVKMSKKGLVAAFFKHWDSTTWLEKGFRTEFDAEMSGATGADMLRIYYDKYGAGSRIALAVERCADITIDGLIFRYIVDRVDDLGGGKIRLVDYKTGKSVPSTPEQLRVYQKLAERDTTFRLGSKQLKVDSLMFLHVNTCKEYPMDRAKPAQLKELWSRVLEAADGVRAAEFPANKGDNCRWCDYSAQCSNDNACGAKDLF